MEIDDYSKKIREEADTYERTIQTIIAFDSAIRWNDDKKDYLENSFFSQGRKFLREISGDNNYVTPDIAIQLSDDLGIIAEIKLTASNDRDFRKAHEQIEKYDGNLLGWKTEDGQIRTHDLSLLVDDFNKNIAIRYFDDKNFRREFTLVACARVSQAQQFYKIEKYYGQFSDERIDAKLSDPVAIPMQKIIAKVSEIKFYDARPPVEYIMNVLWMNIFGEIKERIQKKSEKYIIVSCKEITNILRRKYAFKQVDSRQPKRPKTRWIKYALEVFSKIGYAHKDPNDNDKYQIKYFYPRREDMLDFFSKKTYDKVLKRKRSKPEGKQLEMHFQN